MVNLVHSRNKDLKRKSYRGKDSLFGYLDYYDVEYSSVYRHHGYLVIELVNIFETADLLDYFSPCERAMVASGWYKLLLFYPKEPVSYRLIKTSLDALNNHFIPNKNIILVTGEHGPELLREFPSDLTVIPYFWFDMSTLHSYSGRTDISHNPSKSFLCYNGTVKLHRTLMFEQLQDNKDGYVSYLKRIYSKDVVQDEIDNSLLSVHEKIVAQNISYSSPVEIDLSPSQCITNQFTDDLDLYHDTKFSIVTESISSTGSLFITEKTFKAILSMHPFMISGSPGLIAFMQSQGYKSYDLMFDETYDNIRHLTDRMRAIVDQVANCKSTNPESVFDIAHFNRERCLTTDYGSRLNSLLELIDK